MLSFSRLERHFQILDVISRYVALLSQSGEVRASQFNGMPRSSNCVPDRIGETVAKRERAFDKLQKLQALANAERPEVEETIKAAAGHGRGAIKTELILRARYQSGRDWREISDMLHERDAWRVRALVIKRLKEMEATIDSETS